MSGVAGGNGHWPPADRFEPIRKSVLEDFTLSCAGFRLMAYLASKPPSWVISEEHLIRVTGWPANRVRQALRDLHKRGLLCEETERKPNGTIVRRERSLRRDLVVSAGHGLDAGNLAASKPDPSPDLGGQDVSAGRNLDGLSLPQAQLGASKSSPIEKTESFREDGVSREDSQQHDQLPLIVGVRADKGKRGTRIPEDFRRQILADEDAKAWFREHCPDVQPIPALDEFIDYWRGVSGQRGCKLDWVATWRNRMRKKQEDAERFRGRGRPDRNAANNDALAAYLAKQENHHNGRRAIEA